MIEWTAEEMERLRGLLLEGLESGEATEMTADDWRRIRQEVQRRLDLTASSAGMQKSGGVNDESA